MYQVTSVPVLLDVVLRFSAHS